MNKNKNTRLDELLKDTQKRSTEGITLMVIGAGLITLLLSLQLHSVLPIIAVAVVALLMRFKSAGSNKATNDCEIVIRYNEKGTPPEHRKADGSPLVITRRMQDALISVPLGTAIEFTTNGIPAKKVVLKDYDNTAFDYAWLPNGFRLTVKKDIPEGRARTTDIAVNDEPFWLEFAFSKACD
ncbi:MAG: hypothetical protein K2Y22_15235 [Candidatus Obscuribacterales bacterium]|nr:hypothetical protein [Candidatus Obscuribacterales bacterium]